jgi:hypothetical protein
MEMDTKGGMVAMISAKAEDTAYMEWMKLNKFEEWKKIKQAEIMRIQDEIEEAKYERKYMQRLHEKKLS